MKMNSIFRMHVLLGILGLITTLDTIGYSITVFNKTPFLIKAQCTKVGLMPTSAETINPHDDEEVGCGGLDCITGINISYLDSKTQEFKFLAKVSFPIKYKGTITNACGSQAIVVGTEPFIHTKQGQSHGGGAERVTIETINELRFYVVRIASDPVGNDDAAYVLKVQ